MTLKSNYGERCTTKSTNFAVLSIYEYILKHENYDTDYWWLDIGPTDITRLLYQNFTASDWEDLREDLVNWTGFQLEIFSYSILNGNSIISAEKENSLIVHRELDRYDYLILNKFDCIITLIDIVESNEMKEYDISENIADEFLFIVKYHNLLKGLCIDYKEKLGKIIDHSGREYIESQYASFISTLNSD